MTVEQRLEQLEKRNKRLTVALTMMAVVMCAVVTMAATGEKCSEFDTVIAREIHVKNDVGDIVVSLGANDDGDGLVYTSSTKGKHLVRLSATVNSEGTVTTYQPNGKPLVSLGSTGNGGNGLVKVNNKTNEGYAVMAAGDLGGLVEVTNNTGEIIAEMGPDEYGNGLVGAWNRKGKGRTLQPGP